MKLSKATELLAAAGIEDAKREARLLFSHFSGLDSHELYGSDAESDSEALAAAIEKRSERFPLQYIIGEVDFYRERYKVTPDCLIPRSDTEILVDAAVKRLPRGAKFIDICTGSGCVALSTLKNTDSTTAVAVDISEAALSVAKENAESLGLCDRIEFLQADALLSPLSDEVYAVLSNPPYVTESDYKDLEPEIYCEPSIAFLGGEDGLDFYRRLIPLYKDKICSEGFFAFEIGYDQADSVKKIADENSLKTEIIKDFSGLSRVALLRK